MDLHMLMASKWHAVKNQMEVQKLGILEILNWVSLDHHELTAPVGSFGLHVCLLTADFRCYHLSAQCLGVIRVAQ